MLDRYVELLKSGEVVAFPTETVYGLGADATNPDAIKKVFSIKGRPSDNPLIIHISDKKQLGDFAKVISDDAQKLMNTFWPGPLTLIFKKKPEVLDLITAGLDTVALRQPNHPLALRLIEQTGPLAAPSANSSGKPSPTRAEHVKEDFGETFPVIDSSKTDIGLESTVLDITSEPYTIYRPGAISAKEISNVIGKKVVQNTESSKDTAAKSPGTKYSHYAPQAEVRWLKGDVQVPGNTLYLLHRKQPSYQHHHIIYYNRNYRKMAHELYDRFRQADIEKLDAIAIEPFAADQEEELVPALLNRIEKALSK